MAAELAKIWDGRIIFVPELISKKSIYFEPMREIHEIMENVSIKCENVHF